MVATRCRFHTQSLRQQATLEEGAASQQGLCKHSHAVVAMHGTRQTRGSTCGSFFGCAGAVGGCAYTEHSSAEPDVFCLCACRKRECSACTLTPSTLGGAGCHRTLPRERGVWQVYRDHRGGQPDTESRQCKVAVGHLGLRTPFAVWWGAHYGMDMYSPFGVRGLCNSDPRVWMEDGEGKGGLNRL